MYNREWGEGVWGKSNLPQKSPKVFLNKSLDPPPPQSKIPGSAPEFLIKISTKYLDMVTKWQNSVSAIFYLFTFQQ